MLWNAGELPPDWTVAKLKAKHSSRPFNPDVANAFFRAGMIEAWGRGIELILQACRDAHSPEPKLLYEQTGLWVEFAFSDRAVQVTTQETTQDIATSAIGPTALATPTLRSSRRGELGRLSTKNIRGKSQRWPSSCRSDTPPTCPRGWIRRPNVPFSTTSARMKCWRSKSMKPSRRRVPIRGRGASR
jgi:hypothetical protein